MRRGFERQYKIAAKTFPRVMIKTVYRIAAQRLLSEALQLCKEHADALIKTTRRTNSLDIKGPDDFAEEHHPASYEPVERERERERLCHSHWADVYVVANKINKSEIESGKTKGKQQPVKWSCCSECKVVAEAEVDAIVNLRHSRSPCKI